VGEGDKCTKDIKKMKKKARDEDIKNYSFLNLSGLFFASSYIICTVFTDN
jgi:hypothetical protein